MYSKYNDHKRTTTNDEKSGPDQSKTNLDPRRELANPDQTDAKNARKGAVEDEKPTSDAMDSGRADRFVDTGETSDMFKSKSINDLKPFYNGAMLNDRMAEIRQSIYHIRQHWDDYDAFLESVKNLIFKERDLEFKDESTRQNAETLLSTKRDWLPLTEQKAKASYEAIKTYTSQEGYNKIFGLSNEMFRREGSVSTVELVRNVTFIVELLNIDLFNYCVMSPNKVNFEGVVYRGQCVTKEDLELYRSLRNDSLNKRNISIPLGLVSSSFNRDVAEDFISKNLEKQKDDSEKKMHPLLFKINVIGLKPEHVTHYTKTFPTSVLSTICAVDIHQLSVYPEECEVLLRGPFFVVLDLYREEAGVHGHQCDVLECVMLNANRDHISTSFLGDQDARAREMFGTMVNVTRSEFALKYCKEKGLLDDAKEYEKVLSDSSAKLERLMSD